MLAVAVLATVASCAATGAARAGGLPGGDPLRRLRAEASGQLAQPASSQRAGIIWVALGSGAMLLVVFSAVQTKRPPRLACAGAQTPEGGAHMRRRFNEREGGGAELVEAPAGEAPEAGDGGFAELGQHVATVLATARESAERTVGDAYAEQKRQEADEAAAEALARAERQSRERARAAEERQQALASHVERTEERLRKLVTGLRELAGRLDVLVGSDALVELVEPEPEVSQPAALDEALRRQVPQPVEVETRSDGQ